MSSPAPSLRVSLPSMPTSTPSSPLHSAPTSPRIISSKRHSITTTSNVPPASPRAPLSSMLTLSDLALESWNMQMRRSSMEMRRSSMEMRLTPAQVDQRRASTERGSGQASLIPSPLSSPEKRVTFSFMSSSPASPSMSSPSPPSVPHCDSPTAHHATAHADAATPPPAHHTLEQDHSNTQESSSIADSAPAPASSPSPVPLSSSAFFSCPPPSFSTLPSFHAFHSKLWSLLMHNKHSVPPPPTIVHNAHRRFLRSFLEKHVPLLLSPPSLPILTLRDLRIGGELLPLVIHYLRSGAPFSGLDIAGNPLGTNVTHLLPLLRFPKFHASLSQQITLFSLDIACCNIPPSAFVTLASALTTSPLRTLILGFNNDNRNEFGVEGGAALAHAIPQSNLATLSVRSLSTSLPHLIQQLTSWGPLSQLDISGNWMGEKTWKMCVQTLMCSSIQQLNLAKNRFSVKGASLLFNYLSTTTTLQRLSLASCCLTSSADPRSFFTLMCASLIKNRSCPLTNLVLDENNVGSEGCKQIGMALPSLSLLSLSLVNCNISDLQYISWSLSRCSLTHLDLSQNPCGDGGGLALGLGLTGRLELDKDESIQYTEWKQKGKVSPLKKLALKRCAMSDVGLSHLAAALERCNLEHLEVNDNDVTNVSGAAMLRRLREQRIEDIKLQYVNLTMNRISQDIIESINNITRRVRESNERRKRKKFEAEAQQWWSSSIYEFERTLETIQQRIQEKDYYDAVLREKENEFARLQQLSAEELAQLSHTSASLANDRSVVQSQLPDVEHMVRSVWKTVQSERGDEQRVAERKLREEAKKTEAVRQQLEQLKTQLKIEKKISQNSIDEHKQRLMMAEAALSEVQHSLWTYEREKREIEAEIVPIYFTILRECGVGEAHLEQKAIDMFTGMDERQKKLKYLGESADYQPAQHDSAHPPPTPRTARCLSYIFRLPATSRSMFLSSVVSLALRSGDTALNTSEDQWARLSPRSRSALQRIRGEVVTAWSEAQDKKPSKKKKKKKANASADNAASSDISHAHAASSGSSHDSSHLSLHIELVTNLLQLECLNKVIGTNTVYSLVLQGLSPGGSLYVTLNSSERTDEISEQWNDTYGVYHPGMRKRIKVPPPNSLTHVAPPPLPSIHVPLTMTSLQLSKLVADHFGIDIALVNSLGYIPHKQQNENQQLLLKLREKELQKASIKGSQSARVKSEAPESKVKSSSKKIKLSKKKKMSKKKKFDEKSSDSSASAQPHAGFRPPAFGLQPLSNSSSFPTRSLTSSPQYSPALFSLTSPSSSPPSHNYMLPSIDHHSSDSLPPASMTTHMKPMGTSLSARLPSRTLDADIDDAPRRGVSFALPRPPSVTNPFGYSSSASTSGHSTPSAPITKLNLVPFKKNDRLSYSFSIKPSPHNANPSAQSSPPLVPRPPPYLLGAPVAASSAPVQQLPSALRADSHGFATGLWDQLIKDRF